MRQSAPPLVTMSSAKDTKPAVQTLQQEESKDSSKKQGRQHSTRAKGKPRSTKAFKGVHPNLQGQVYMYDGAAHANQYDKPTKKISD